MRFLSTTRRRVLAFGAAGAGLLAAGEAFRWFAFGYDAGPGAAWVALSRKEFVVVRSIVEALLPEGEGFPSGVAAGVVARIDEEVFAQSPGLKSDMKAAIQLIEHAPPLVGSFHRLSALDVETRAVVIDKLSRTGPDVVVQAMVALKEMCSLFYFGNDASWSAIGYDGPWVKTPSPPPSHAHYEHAKAASER